jgi:CubicO group peptidase (beta-lactamase class C family)
MRRLSPVLAVVLTVLFSRLSIAADLELTRLAAYFESLRVQAGIPGLAVAVVDDNTIVWEQAFGWLNVERLVATRTDTPFHLDGLTQLFTSALVLRCVEEGRLSLDERMERFKPDSPDANATVWNLLTHTSGSGDSLVYAYRPERLDLLARAIRVCTDNSYRETLAGLLDRLAMVDSVPGPDIVFPETLSEGIPSPSAVERYKRVLDRLATPYAVDQRRRSLPSQYTPTTITPSAGLISTVRDLANFDLALKKGLLVRADTLATMWQAPASNGVRLPHGMGWFVQSYNGETLVWQFGMEANASSSLIVTVPGRRITLILLANSDSLVKPYQLAAGDVTVSPFVRLFLGLALR